MSSFLLFWVIPSIQKLQGKFPLAQTSLDINQVTDPPETLLLLNKPGKESRGTVQDTTSYAVHFNKEVLKLFSLIQPPDASTKTFLYTQLYIKSEFKVNHSPCSLHPVWNEKCWNNTYKYLLMRFLAAFLDGGRKYQTTSQNKAKSLFLCDMQPEFIGFKGVTIWMNFK